MDFQAWEHQRQHRSLRLTSIQDVQQEIWLCGGRKGSCAVYAGCWNGVADTVYIAGSRPQKGIASYSLSANRQRPLAGTFRAAIFNTARRTGGQILYVVPPFLVAYYVMHWSIERWVTSIPTVQ